MTQDEIIELAKQVGWDEHHAKLDTRIQAFAKLVAQHEREACANLCWKNQDDNAFVNAYNGKRLDLLCSELIRTRGKND
jgi:hypothetical protein